MFKPSFKNILLYVLFKYLLFYVFLMFKNNDLRLIQLRSLVNFQDWVYYFWTILFFPILNIILFSIPIYFLFRLKNIIQFLLALGVILILEYFVYVFFSSDKHIDMNGIYNGIISLVIFYFFFYKSIGIKKSSQS